MARTSFPVALGSLALVLLPAGALATPTERDFNRLRDAVDDVATVLEPALVRCTGASAPARTVTVGYTLGTTGSLSDVTVSHGALSACVRGALKGAGTRYSGPRVRVEIPWRRHDPLATVTLSHDPGASEGSGPRGVLSLRIENHGPDAIEVRTEHDRAAVLCGPTGEATPRFAPPTDTSALSPIPSGGSAHLAFVDAKARGVAQGRARIGVEIWRTDIGRV